MSSISFLIPCKNESKFLPAMCESLLANDDRNWEAIFVDDHSTDETANILRQLSNGDPRIRVCKNPGHGKVEALNEAYAMSSFPIIKLIDADDLISSNLVSTLIAYHERIEAVYHPLELIDEFGTTIRKYLPGRRVCKYSYPKIVENFVSIPKACWSFKREVAARIFPIPEALPYEDVWITFRLKMTNVRIGYCSALLYKYRQHGSMTFGPMDSFSSAMVIYRARRSLRLIDALLKHADFQDHAPALHRLRIDQSYLAGDISLMRYGRVGRGGLRQLKNIVIKLAPTAASWLQRRVR